MGEKLNNRERMRFMFKDIFKKNPECLHFDKTFKGHSKWMPIKGRQYGMYADDYRELYFECDDCGEIITNYQERRGDRLMNYVNIKTEEMEV